MKDFVKNNKKAFYLIFLVFMAILGYLLMTLVFCKPSNEERLDYLEQVAYDVYEQRENVIVEVPKDVTVEMDATSIKVRTKQWDEDGEVVLTLKDGKPALERNHNTGSRIFLGVLLGIVFFLVGALILISCENKKERKNIP